MTTTTRRRHEYRYRDNSCGVTRISLERMRKHLRKIGRPQVVRAYRFRSKRQYRLAQLQQYTEVTREAVLVKGTRGTARFEGFCWGYGGEGPRGLRNLLLMLGVPVGVAMQIAFEKQRKDECGTDWEYQVPAQCIPVWQL